MQITLISRRAKPSLKRGRAAQVVRGISNENELHAALQGIQGATSQLVDLSVLTIAEQIDLIANTDILVGIAPPTNKLSFQGACSCVFQLDL